MSDKKQHVDISRKLKIRRRLIEKAPQSAGAVYVPFIGEGDIAAELYQGRRIYGADNDPKMVAKAKSKLPEAEIITADCDQYPFKRNVATFSLADFDSYSYPYDSFRKFFEGAKIGSHCVLFFTDEQRQAIIRTGHYRTPDGERHHLTNITAKREVYNFYFDRTILPWFREYIKPWKIVDITKYLRGPNQMYWGAVIARPGKQAKPKVDKGSEAHRNKFDAIKKEQYLEQLRSGFTRGRAASAVGIHRATVSIHMNRESDFAAAVSEAESDAAGKVEEALFEAATSGNVTAIQVYLYNRSPDRWSDKRSVRLAEGSKLEIEVDAKNLSDEELAAIINRRSGGGTAKKAPGPQ